MDHAIKMDQCSLFAPGKKIVVVHFGPRFCLAVGLKRGGGQNGQMYSIRDETLSLACENIDAGPFYPCALRRFRIAGREWQNGPIFYIQVVTLVCAKINGVPFFPTRFGSPGCLVYSAVAGVSLHGDGSNLSPSCLCRISEFWSPFYHQLKGATDEGGA